MTDRIPRHERLARSILLLQDMGSVGDTLDGRRSSDDEWQAEAERHLARMLEEVVPELNGHLRAMGRRPVDPDRANRRRPDGGRPSARMQIALLGMRFASRLDSVEQTYLRTNPDGRRLVDETHARLRPVKRILPDSDEPVAF